MAGFGVCLPPRDAWLGIRRDLKVPDGLGGRKLAADCAERWAGGDFAVATAASITITNDTTGFVVFDITSWLNGVIQAAPNTPLRFLVKKDNDGAPGRIDFYSK